MKTEHETFGPDWISAPGDTIAELLNERHLTNEDLADRLDRTSEYADELLLGHAIIDDEVALKLAALVGGSVNFWLSRERQYRDDLNRWRAEVALQNYRQWLSEIPTAEMVKLKWIGPSESQEDIAVACLQFFGVRTIKAWSSVYGKIGDDVNFRTSATFNSNPAVVATWLRQGELEASSIECSPWNPEMFRSRLMAIRDLTRVKDPAEFIPLLRDACASCGVALVVLRAPSGCCASGAARFVAAGRPIIQLSFRHLSDDHFWFSFFHEAGHLILHGENKLFLEDGLAESSHEEKEANDFAMQILLPHPFLEELLSIIPTPYSIARFARRAGISPGIIVGQLQFHKRIKPSHLNALKRRYVWIEQAVQPRKALK